MAKIEEVKAYESIRNVVISSRYEIELFQRICKEKENHIRSYIGDFKNVVAKTKETKENVLNVKMSALELRKNSESLLKALGDIESENSLATGRLREKLEMATKINEANEGNIAKYNSMWNEHYEAFESIPKAVDRKKYKEKLEILRFEISKSERELAHMKDATKKCEKIKQLQANNAVIEFAAFMIDKGKKLALIDALQSDVAAERARSKSLGKKMMEVFAEIKNIKMEKYENSSREMERLKEKKFNCFVPTLTFNNNCGVPFLELPKQVSNTEDVTMACDDDALFKKPQCPVNESLFRFPTIKCLGATKKPEEKAVQRDAIKHRDENASRFNQLIRDENVNKTADSDAINDEPKGVKVIENVLLKPEETVAILSGLKKRMQRSEPLSVAEFASGGLMRASASQDAVASDGGNHSGMMKLTSENIPVENCQVEKKVKELNTNRFDFSIEASFHDAEEYASCDDTTCDTIPCTEEITPMDHGQGMDKPTADENIRENAIANFESEANYRASELLYVSPKIVKIKTPQKNESEKSRFFLTNNNAGKLVQEITMIEKKTENSPQLEPLKKKVKFYNATEDVGLQDNEYNYECVTNKKMESNCDALPNKQVGRIEEVEAEQIRSPVTENKHLNDGADENQHVDITSPDKASSCNDYSSYMKGLTTDIYYSSPLGSEYGDDASLTGYTQRMTEDITFLMSPKETKVDDCLKQSSSKQDANVMSSFGFSNIFLSDVKSTENTKSDHLEEPRNEPFNLFFNNPSKPKSSFFNFLN